jgi:hypothetical protein
VYVVASEGYLGRGKEELGVGESGDGDVATGKLMCFLNLL